MNQQELITCIKRIQSHAKEYRKKLLRNETMTKNMLITPMLEALGWKLGANLEMEVITEDNKFVDYGLFIDDTLVLILEAKAMGNKLLDNKEVFQVSGYANKKGIGPYILSNGITYKIYNQKLDLKPPEEFVYEVNILSENQDSIKIESIAKKLTLFSKEYLILNKLNEFFESHELKTKVIKAINTLVSNTIKNTKPNILSAIRNTINDKTIKPIKIRQFLDKNWRDLSSETNLSTAIPEEVNNGYGLHQQTDFLPPGKMKIQNDLFQVNKYNEILINTANWLIKRGKIDTSICPVMLPRSKRYLIHIKPYHPNGNRFFSEKKLNNGLFINTNYSGQACIRNAQRLLKMYNYSEGDLIFIQ